MPSGTPSQTTQYVYGVTGAINSNDMLAATQYPDLTTGAASSGQQETYVYDALGDRTGMTDRNGNVHAYTFDVLGRQTLDAVATLGSGVDGSIRAIGTTFNSQGLPFKLTSYSDSSATSVANQIERIYNGFGQLTDEYQDHFGAVNTSATPEVQYGYSSISDCSRKSDMIYPDGRQIDYNYSSGVNADISRLSSITDDATGTVLESYKYLGGNTIVERDHPEDGVNLTYIGTGTADSGDQYTGLDRFGRVVDQKWTTFGGTVKDEYTYTYDRDSNVLTKGNALDSALSDVYTYDNLNRLIDDTRGGTDHQSFTLDALGNQTSVTTDGTAVSSTFNSQNELTGNGSSTLTYDNNGNNTTDQTGNTYTYDAWNHQISVTNAASTAIEGYVYDATGRRIEEHTQSGGSLKQLYYSDQCQVLEVRNSSGTPKIQYVWSPVYVNALIERDRDADNNSGTGTNGLDERLYATQDANWNTTSEIDTSGTVVERDQYEPYGSPTFMDSSFTPISGNASAYGWNTLFQGGRYDPTSGFYIFQHRDEDPTLGIWNEQDPYAYIDGENLYDFARSNSVNLTDPAGTDSDGEDFQSLTATGKTSPLFHTDLISDSSCFPKGHSGLDFQFQIKDDGVNSSIAAVWTLKLAMDGGKCLCCPDGSKPAIKFKQRLDRTDLIDGKQTNQSGLDNEPDGIAGVGAVNNDPNSWRPDPSTTPRLLGDNVWILKDAPGYGFVAQDGSQLSTKMTITVEAYKICGNTSSKILTATFGLGWYGNWQSKPTDGGKAGMRFTPYFSPSGDFGPASTAKKEMDEDTLND